MGVAEIGSIELARAAGLELDAYRQEHVRSEFVVHSSERASAMCPRSPR